MTYYVLLCFFQLKKKTFCSLYNLAGCDPQTCSCLLSVICIPNKDSIRNKTFKEDNGLFSLSELIQISKETKDFKVIFYIKDIQLIRLL